MKLLVITLVIFLAIPASAQVRLMSLYNITPERSELMLDTPFDTVQHNTNDIVLLYRIFNGIYKISYWLNKSEAIELTPHDKWFKFRQADFLNLKKFEVHNKKLLSYKESVHNEKVENNRLFKIIKDFDNPDDGPSLEIIFEELNGFVSKISVKKQKIVPTPGGIQLR